MADHSQYPDDLCKTTGLNKCSDFTEDNIGHIGSQDNDRENTIENEADGVMETIEIRVEKSQNKKQLNNDGENCSAKDNNSKDEKTEICRMCEVADDKGVNENNRRKCKTSNREEGVKSNNGIVEQDKSVPKTDEDNFPTNKKCMTKGKKGCSTPRINLHPTEIIRNRVTNLPHSLLCALKYSKKENNGDEISSNRKTFEEYQNFITQEKPRLNVSKLYPPRTSSRRYKTSSEGRIYNSSERKTMCTLRRTSESKVSAPVKRRTSSYSRNTNNSTDLNSPLPPCQSNSQRFNQLRDSLELARLRWAQETSFRLHSPSNSGRNTTSRYRFPSPGSSSPSPPEASIHLHRISSAGPDTIVDPRKFQHQVCPFVTWDRDTSRWSRDLHDGFAGICGGAHSPKPTSDSSGSSFSDFVAGRDSMSTGEINSHLLNRKWNNIYYGRNNLKLRESRVKYQMPDIEQRLF
ncbi:Hypothetical predicted protein [Octopus vulgaris]|uniref:Uncharacterized protein n=1 Tax=Octopus vulgaris TaxID=6645 RepID=A0AA36AWL2_OCTVU|nr:Hypothetical predicted protein [Octopus vulgaris]